MTVARADKKLYNYTSWIKILVKNGLMKTIYLNLEDDLTRTVAKIHAHRSEDVLLVIPKNSYLLSDSINLRLLKKQVDLLGNKVYILTMDQAGQVYAKEAGFELRQLPKISKSNVLSDIRPRIVQSIPKRTEFKRAIVPPSQKVVHIKSAPQIKSAKIYKTHSQPNISADSNISNNWLAEADTTPISKRENVFIPPDSHYYQLKPRKSYKKWIVVFVAIVMFITALLVVVVLPSANVILHIKPQIIARDLEAKIDSNVSVVDGTGLIIPATNVEQTRKVSATFSTNGKKEVGSKAEGRIAIYNLTGSPLNLKTETTVLVVGSKAYLLKNDVSGIVALPDINSDSKATIVDVVAQEGGESFNLPAGTRMEINNQAFGSQPQRLFAKTVTQIIGGSSRFISTISKEDLNTAQQELIKQAVGEINKNFLTNQKLVEGAYAVELQDFVTDKPELTEAVNFSATASVVVKGLAFDEGLLKNIIRTRILQTLGSDKSLQESEKDIIVYKIKNLDLTQGQMLLALHYESKSLPLLDIGQLTVDLAGKSEGQASEVLLSNPNIAKAEILLAPSWQKSFPRLGGKIFIEIIK